jgi:hypothetical protein
MLQATAGTTQTQITEITIQRLGIVPIGHSEEVGYC